jgi:preprotein translocase subunit YajC
VATVILLALFVLMWVVLIVPRQRELKRHTRLLAELAVGDEVMTGAGIYGVVRAIDGEYVRLEVADGVELKVAKRAVMAKVPAEADRAALDASGDVGTAGPDDAVHAPGAVADGGEAGGRAPGDGGATVAGDDTRPDAA